MTPTVRRLLLLPVLGLGFLLLPATPASAATCRGFQFDRAPQSEVVYRAYDIRASRVGCTRARRHIRRFHADSNQDRQLNCAEGGSCSFRGYRCTTRVTRRSSSHRCTRGDRIIRWRHGYRYVA